LTQQQVAEVLAAEQARPGSGITLASQLKQQNLSNTRADAAAARADAAAAAQLQQQRVTNERLDRNEGRRLQIDEAKAAEDAKGKLPPQQIAGGMLENVNAIRKIDDALAALDARSKKDAEGKIDPNTGEGVGYWPGMTPDFVLKRTDPDGNRLRALIADIGSLKLHDRSGANVTASESPRLVPFIPAIGDDPKTIRDKLGNFRREYEAALRDQYSVYGPGTGHRALAPVEEALKRRSGCGVEADGI
jgi:hypothetical protein